MRRLLTFVGFVILATGSVFSARATDESVTTKPIETEVATTTTETTTTTEVATTTETTTTVTSTEVPPIPKVVVPTRLTDISSWSKDFEFTYIGDSLGVGVEPYLKQHFPKANFNSLVSRFVTNTAAPHLDGRLTLKEMADTNQVKDVLVVALGTNGGITQAQFDAFLAEVPENVKHIVWITSRSGDTDSEKLRDFLNGQDVHVIDWYQGADAWGWVNIVSPDGVHMNNPKPYADFQAQGLYELFVNQPNM